MKLLSIDDCKKCHHLKRIYGAEYTCKHKQVEDRKHPYTIFNQETFKIPEWCPLPEKEK